MSIETALRNYRIAAWVTGVGLLVLVLVAMPLKYVFGRPELVAVVGVTHGFLYMIYIVCTLLLAERAGGSRSTPCSSWSPAPSRSRPSSPSAG